jgi:hypothetical protein
MITFEKNYKLIFCLDEYQESYEVKVLSTSRWQKADRMCKMDFKGAFKILLKI